MIQKYNEVFRGVYFFKNTQISSSLSFSNRKVSKHKKNVHSIMKGKKMGTEAGTRRRNRQSFP